MNEQDFMTSLMEKGKHLVGLVQEQFPGADVNGKIATVPDDPDCVALVLTVEYRARVT